MAQAKQYDNSAFYYFLLTLLVLYALPTSIYAALRFVRMFRGGPDVAGGLEVRHVAARSDVGLTGPGPQARTAAEREKIEKLRAKERKKRRRIGPGFLCVLVTLVASWAMVAYLGTLIGQAHELVAFDPFQVRAAPIRRAPGGLRGPGSRASASACRPSPTLACPSRPQILGVPSDANDAQIRRAWHKLSLVYHPDKTKGACAGRARGRHRAADASSPARHGQATVPPRTGSSSFQRPTMR